MPHNVQLHQLNFWFQYGLYSAFMGCFVYCFLGTSKDITLGPTAIMSLMTAEFAHGDAVVAIILSFMCGLVQVFMGLFYLGKHVLASIIRLVFVLRKNFES